MGIRLRVIAMKEFGAGLPLVLPMRTMITDILEPKPRHANTMLFNRSQVSFHLAISILFGFGMREGLRGASVVACGAPKKGRKSREKLCSLSVEETVFVALLRCITHTHLWNFLVIYLDILGR